ncbi:MAG: hypothetical protein GXY18_01550 [Methanomicrobiales archaeon]|nr:hypothetical protein [Methanomicrobiales archaeon]
MRYNPKEYCGKITGTGDGPSASSCLHPGRVTIPSGISPLASVLKVTIFHEGVLAGWIILQTRHCHGLLNGYPVSVSYVVDRDSITGCHPACQTLVSFAMVSSLWHGAQADLRSVSHRQGSYINRDVWKFICLSYATFSLKIFADG